MQCTKRKESSTRTCCWMANWTPLRDWQTCSPHHRVNRGQATTSRTSSYELWRVGPDYARGTVRRDVGTEVLVHRDQNDKRLRSSVLEAAPNLARAICAVSMDIGKMSARSGSGKTAMAGRAHRWVYLRNQTRVRAREWAAMGSAGAQGMRAAGKCGSTYRTTT